MDGFGEVVMDGFGEVVMGGFGDLNEYKELAKTHSDGFKVLFKR
jgi:hypothetical protein